MKSYINMLELNYKKNGALSLDNTPLTLKILYLQPRLHPLTWHDSFHIEYHAT